MIKEIIVVEGRDDVTAVKAAVEAEVIAVHGFGITQDSFDRILRASLSRGVIVLTDPDHAGESIRRRIEAAVPGVRHAYISRQEGTRKGDVGVENASPEAIREALARVHANEVRNRQEFSPKELFELELMAGKNAKVRRERLGKILGIGYASASVLLNRLNHYGISRQEFLAAIKKMEAEDDRKA